MGRGRAKAKQTKVARELKYSSGNTDLGALQAELARGGHHPPAPPAAKAVKDDEDGDPYSKYADTDEDDD